MLPDVVFMGYKDTVLLDFIKNNSNNFLFVNVDEKITEEMILNYDFLVSFGYKFILKNDILKHFKNAAVNLHISYLPYNRGAEPNFWSFVENSPKGISIHYMNEGLDRGDIIAQKELFFDEKKESFSTSYNTLKGSIEELFIQNWKNIISKQVKAKKQIGVGSYHKSSDSNELKKLLPNGWDSNIAEFLEILKNKNS